MYSNDIVNFQESTPILNARKKSLETYRMHLVYSFIYVYECTQYMCVYLASSYKS